MADTWVTDMRHYLNEIGELPDEMPSPALRIALFQGSVIAWMTGTDSLDGQTSRTNVNCRRNPERRPCPGEILAFLEIKSEAIIWECPLCGDNGRISGWEGTSWDRRVADA